VLLAAALAALALPAAAARYAVRIDGAVINLSGFIEIGATGTFALADFDAAVTSFSITASNNGVDPFTFTESDSSFASGSPTGASSITMTVTADGIALLSASDATRAINTDIFLVTDGFVGGARPNLIYTNRFARYLKDGGSVYSDDFGSSPRVFATAAPVPLPAAGALYPALLLAVLGMARLRRVG
jgi:hypothetical protein